MKPLSNGMVRAATSLLTQVDAVAAPASLVECVQGNAAAWRTLHRQFYPVAAAFLRKLGVQPPELEDACQDVFLQLVRSLPSFRGESEFETWLYRLCLTQARRARVRQRVSRLLSWLPGEALVSAPSFCEHSARQRIEAALARLSAADRSVFVLYEMEGLPGARVAEIVGCKEATLWRRLHYARKRFLDALEQTEVAR
jgi:RNA polymerase sigma-70 factor, ECF subfamily